MILTEKTFRKIIQEELAKCMTRTMVIETGPRKQGDPDGKVTKEEQINMLDFWTIYSPRIEAALRGLQEDVDKTKNKINSQAEKIDAIGNVLIGMETSALRLANASDEVVKLKLVER